MTGKGALSKVFISNTLLILLINLIYSTYLDIKILNKFAKANVKISFVMANDITNPV